MPSLTAISNNKSTTVVQYPAVVSCLTGARADRPTWSLHTIA